MSSWKELHDDFLQDVMLYVEEVKITPEQVMRYLTRGMSEFQRLTNIVEDTKAITPGIGADLTDYMTPFPVGADIQEVFELRDTTGARLLQVSWQQFKDIIERAESPDGEYDIGFAETPAHWSRIRRGPSGGENARWGVGYGDGVVRIYAIWNQQLYRYPVASTDTQFTMWYRVALDAYSSLSTQWTAWFAPGAFMGQFVGTGPHPAIERWERAFVSHATAQYLRPVNVLAGDQPAWQQFDTEFRNYVVQAIETRPVDSHELVAPYNVGPYSS